jgi:hypothetical protein
MIKNYVRILVKDNSFSKDFNFELSQNINNNIIIEFNNDNASKIHLDFLNNHKKKSKKSVVVISTVLTNENYLFSIVPTFQEALDIIELEEIERLIS